MSWVVETGDEFKPEFFDLHKDVQTEILALARLLQQFGPQLGRPRVDTLSSSSNPNLKELRLARPMGNGELFLLSIRGASEKQFYRDLIRKADERFNRHLNRLKGRT